MVPKDLRPFVDNKTELRSALGPDHRRELQRLHGAVAQLQHQIALAERKAQSANGARATPGRYPLTPDQIARQHYRHRRAFDKELRGDPRYALVGIDDLLVQKLRDGISVRRI